MGMPTGTFMARMMPVTTADRSLMGFAFFISLQYSHSKATQATTDTAVKMCIRDSLEQHSLALHDRQACLGADVTQTQHGGAVGDDSPIPRWAAFCWLRTMWD